MTDWDLVQDYIQHRSDAAFRRLIERHMAFVYQVCRRETADRQVAEDSAMAVFLLLAQKAQTIRPGVQLTSWLFSAARLTAKNAVRQEYRRKATEQRANEMAQYENQARRDEAVEFVGTHLNEALAALSHREREAVLLRYQDDLEVADVGRTLGISESAAQMRLSRSLAKMRRLFARRGSPLSIAVIAAALVSAKSQAAPAALCAKAVEAGAAGLASLSPGTLLAYKGALKTMAMTKIKMAATVAAVLLVGVGATVAIHRTLADATSANLGHNAFDYFSRAGEMVKSDNNNDTPITVDADPAADATLVARNQNALGILRAGFAYQYIPPEVHYDTKMPYLNEYRTLVRLLVAEGRVKARSGDLAAAANSDLDAVQLGETIPNQSPLISYLVGFACDAIGRRDIWSNLKNLTSQQALNTEQRLIAIDSRRVPFSAAIKAEGTSAQTWPWTAEQASEKDAYIGYLGRLAQIVDLPYGEKPALPEQPPAIDPLSDEQKRVLSGGESPLQANATVAEIEMDNAGFSKIWYRGDLDEIRTEELIAALALQAYHVDKGTYPQSLSSLIPKYLPQMPRDLLATDAPLQYHSMGNSYVLYSVGPDGIDNGGQAAESSGTDLNSKGDIVANVNGW